MGRCLLEAIDEAAKQARLPDCVADAHNMIRRVIGPEVGLANWNDAEHRTKGQVIDMLEAAEMHAKEGNNP